MKTNAAELCTIAEHQLEKLQANKQDHNCVRDALEHERDAFVKKLGDAHEKIHCLTALVSTQDSHIIQL